MMRHALIRIEDLNVTFAGRRTVLNGINADIAAGDAMALIGSNGAGKTTLLRVLAGQIWPTSGQILIADQSTTACRRDLMSRIGMSLYPERSFYYRLTVDQNLRYFQGLNGHLGREARSRRDVLLEKVGLDSLRKHKFMELSLGQRARLGLARAILNDPPVLLLDEPFANLDEAGRQVVADVIVARRARGMTTVFTTHSLEDVQHAVSSVGRIERGSLTVAAITGGATDESSVSRLVRVEVFRLPGADSTQVLSRWRGELTDGRFILDIPASTRLSEVLTGIERAGYIPSEIVDAPMGANR